jgi:hypothetical protein
VRLNFPLIFIKKWKETTNGSNWPGVVIVRINSPNFIAVLGQEVYESRLKTLVLLPIILLTVMICWFLGVPFQLIPIPILLSSMLLAVPMFKRYLELKGHMIETVIARDLYGEDFNTYAIKEVADLAYYGQFKGRSKESILSDMLKYKDFAEKWVNRNKRMLNGYAAKY